MTTADEWLNRLYDAALAEHREQAGASGYADRKIKLKQALRRSIGVFERNASAAVEVGL